MRDVRAHWSIASGGASLALLLMQTLHTSLTPARVPCLLFLGVDAAAIPALIVPYAIRLAPLLREVSTHRGWRRLAGAFAWLTAPRSAALVYTNAVWVSVFTFATVPMAIASHSGLDGCVMVIHNHAYVLYFVLLTGTALALVVALRRMATTRVAAETLLVLCAAIVAVGVDWAMPSSSILPLISYALLYWVWVIALARPLLQVLAARRRGREAVGETPLVSDVERARRALERNVRRHSPGSSTPRGGRPTTDHDTGTIIASYVRRGEPVPFETWRRHRLPWSLFGNALEGSLKSMFGAVNRMEEMRFGRGVRPTIQEFLETVDASGVTVDSATFDRSAEWVTGAIAMARRDEGTRQDRIRVLDLYLGVIARHLETAYEAYMQTDGYMRDVNDLCGGVVEGP